MHIIAEVNKISKIVQHNLTFIFNVLSEFSIRFTLLTIVLVKKNVGISHKMVFIKNQAVQLHGKVQGHLELRSSVQTIQFSSLKSLVFVVHFSNTFLHGNETFPKDSSQNEIFPLLVVFHLRHSQYKGVGICFYSCRYQNQIFLLVSHSCRLCNTCVALVSLV